MPLFARPLVPVTAMLLLAACGGAAVDQAPRAAAAPVAGPVVADAPVKVGVPYTVSGQTWTPLDQADYDEVGYASWYGGELEGAATANGEQFHAARISGAHRTLPMPSYVEVTRLDTGRTILVRLNDRGPADPRRLIDLSAAAAEELGIASRGPVAVRVRRTNPVESERMALRSGAAVPPRIDTPESLLAILRDHAARLPSPSPSLVPTPAAPTIAAPAGPHTPVQTVAARPPSTPPAAPLIVQVGAFSSLDRAQALARRIGGTVATSGSVHRVRLGPFATEAEAQAAVTRVRSMGQPGAVIQHGP